MGNREALCHLKVYTKNFHNKIEIMLKVFKNIVIKLGVYFNMCRNYTEKICKMIKNYKLLQQQMTKANNLYNKSDDLQIEKEKENAVIKLNKFFQTNKQILKDSYLNITQNSHYKKCDNKTLESLRIDIHKK